MRVQLANLHESAPVDHERRPSPGELRAGDFARRPEFAQISVEYARLEHPHLVPLHDYWRDPEGAYLDGANGSIQSITVGGRLSMVSSFARGLKPLLLPSFSYPRAKSN